MSVHAMSVVFKATDLKPTEKLILLAIANHANSEGKCAYPSVDLLMDETGLSDRAIQINVRALTKKKILSVDISRDGVSTNQYAINIELLEEMEHERYARNRKEVEVPAAIGDESDSSRESDSDEPLTDIIDIIDTNANAFVSSSGESDDGKQILLFMPSVPAGIQKKPNRSSILNQVLHELESAFAAVRGCPNPSWDTQAKAKESQKRWRTPVREILELCGGDPKYAKVVIERVTQRMMDDGLSFDAPDGILKCARSDIFDGKYKLHPGVNYSVHADATGGVRI